MKESIGSLRAFFIIVGLLRGFACVMGFLASLLVIALNAPLGIFLLILCGAGALLAAGYLYCGIFLPTLLRTNASVVLLVIMANIGVTLISAIYAVTTSGVAGLLGPMIGLLVSVYLLNTVRRLSSQPI